jgi:hypothetical protein
MKRFAIVLSVLFASVSGPVLAASPCSGAKMSFDASSLSGGEVKELEEKLRRALDNVCNWWGPVFKGPFSIEVKDDSGPSMALLPAWKGELGHMIFRGRNRGNPAVTHEMVHVFAPNANRMLAEGLATYAHEHLGGASAYPNFGQDLHSAARDLSENTSLAAFDALATPRRLRLDGFEENDSYLVAGSFVRFLIEKDGIETFRKLYALTPLESYQRFAGDPDRWEGVFGKGLPVLQAEWKAAINR